MLNFKILEWNINYRSGFQCHNTDIFKDANNIVASELEKSKKTDDYDAIVLVECYAKDIAGDLIDRIEKMGYKTYFSTDDTHEALKKKGCNNLLVAVKNEYESELIERLDTSPNFLHIALPKIKLDLIGMRVVMGNTKNKENTIESLKQIPYYKNKENITIDGLKRTFFREEQIRWAFDYNEHKYDKEYKQAFIGDFNINSQVDKKTNKQFFHFDEMKEKYRLILTKDNKATIGNTQMDYLAYDGECSYEVIKEIKDIYGMAGSYDIDFNKAFVLNNPFPDHNITKATIKVGD